MRSGRLSRARCSRGEGVSGPMPRLLVITNIPTPYNDALFGCLAREPGMELRVAYCAGTESNRLWHLDPRKSYDSVVLKGRSLGGSFHVNTGVARLVSEFRPDVALVSGSYAMPTFQLAVRVLGARKIPWLYWGEELHGEGGHPAKRLIRDLLRGPLRNAAGVLAIGERARRSYAAIGVPEERIANFHYYADTTSFQLAPEARDRSRREVRAKLGLPAEVPTLLYCGQLIYRKGIDTLLDAAAHLRDEGVPFAVAVVGGGEDRDALMRHAADRGVLDRVRFAGFVQPSELPAYFAAADTFVLPSYREGWGVVVPEAMAAGLPVIAADRVNAAVELLNGSGAGFLFPAGDAGALADAMRRLCGSEELRASMAEGARARVRSEAPHVAAGRLVELLRAALAGERIQDL